MNKYQHYANLAQEQAGEITRNAQNWMGIILERTDKMRPTVEIISNFITECRNNALEGLKANNRYAECIKRRGELDTLIQSHLSREGQELLEEYTEIGAELTSMENNTILLCGLSLQTEVSKYLDPATSEYRALANMEVPYSHLTGQE